MSLADSNPDAPFQIGAVFPQTESGADGVAIRDYAQAIEDLGYSHIVAYDHVVGASVASRPHWSMPYSSTDTFHEPLVLFAHLAACTRTLGLTTGVVILPQRQTTLFGKQAATLDVLSGGRLKVGVGTGWNAVEYDALGMNFEDRGRRLDDQVRFLRRLWCEHAFSERGEFHQIDDAGIEPRPLQRPIPIFIGGNAPPAMRRAARLGDGWLPVIDIENAEQTLEQFHAHARVVGRDPATVRIENLVFLGTTMGKPLRKPDDAVKAAELWRKLGVNGVAFHTMAMGMTRIDQHIDLLRTIAEMLELKRP
ncbi:MAG: luciferase family protein [Caulobacteraceae bacterium]|nr:luciferase family protein [Caulobacteraceae bacterium]